MFLIFLCLFEGHIVQMFVKINVDLNVHRIM